MSRFLSSALGRLFILSLVLYVLTTILGYVASQAPGGDEATKRAIQSLAQVLGPMGGLDPPQMMAVIFLNNAVKALAVIALGFSLGIVPFIFLAVNGVITGVVVSAVAAKVGPGMAMAFIAPHGVIEIPAILLASALGFRVAEAVIWRIAGRQSYPGRELKSGLVIYAKVVLPALLVAAGVEAFITPLLIGR